MDEKTRSSELELLAELAEGQRRELLHARITTVVCLVIAALLLVLALLALPRAAETLNRLDGALTALEGTAATLNELDGSLSDIAGAAEQLNGFIENADALSEAAARLGEMDIESLNNGIREICRIDFAKLNQAIGDLADVIQPLAHLTNLFN